VSWPAGHAPLEPWPGPPQSQIVCRAGQAHPHQQQVLVGVPAAFVQPEQDGDRDIGGRAPGAAFLSPLRLGRIQIPNERW